MARPPDGGTTTVSYAAVDAAKDKLNDLAANLARDRAGAAADAGYSDGKALLVRWAMESGMIDQGLITQQWPKHIPAGITASSHGYTVDFKVAGAAEAFQQFVHQNGAVALTDLDLDDKYTELFAIDPGAKYNESKYLG